MCCPLHNQLVLTALLIAITCMACQPTANESLPAKATPSNAAATAKPAESVAKPAETKAAGREVKVADGPALSSITPVEGTILAGTLNDIAVSKPDPEPDPKAEKASGTVTVEVIVNEKGEVSTSSVVSGPQPLWSAAGNAARKARFDPPLKDGKPVKMAGVLTYEFGK